MIKFNSPLKIKLIKKTLSAIDEWGSVIFWIVLILFLVLLCAYVHGESSKYQNEVVPKLKASVNSDFQKYLDSYKIDYKTTNCGYVASENNFYCKYSTGQVIQKIKCEYDRKTLNFSCEN